MHCLVAYTSKSVKDQLTETCRLTPRDLVEGAKFILKLLFLTPRYALRKNQRALPKREQLQKKPDI